MKAWITHAALNLGTVISATLHGLIPPQWTGHDKDDLEYLSSSSPWSEFLFGLQGPDTPKNPS